MSGESHTRNAQLRAIAIYARRPDRVQETNRGRAELRHGLACYYEQDRHGIAMDMPASVGGDGQGPTPGFFGRAALCGCLAIGIKMAAAREDIHLDMVRVDIEQDWDNRGLLGAEGACAAPTGTRIAIAIVSH